MRRRAVKGRAAPGGWRGGLRRRAAAWARRAAGRDGPATRRHLLLDQAAQHLARASRISPQRIDLVELLPLTTSGRFALRRSSQVESPPARLSKN